MKKPSIVRLDLGMVNVYLIATEAGFVLIDTGFTSQRSRVDAALEGAGCVPGSLDLILLTHGDPDHTANASYLRAKYGSKIAMHQEEIPAVERGDMFLSRSRISTLRRMMKPLMSLFSLRKRDRFTPDVTVSGGDRLDAYGLDAEIVHVPGHSRGSVAVLTSDGDFFSGDFLENRRRPSIATFVDDPTALRTSFERVKALDVATVYPGHGAPFPFEAISPRSEASQN